MFNIKEYGKEIACNFTIQPIVSPNLKYVYGFECLTELHFDVAEFCLKKDSFFKSLSDDKIQLLVMAQIKYLNSYSSFFLDNQTIISINMPLSLVLDDGFLEKVINKSKFKIAIEVTDFNGLEENLDSTIKRMEAINRSGVEFWLDDYRSAIPSKIAFLLPWNAIKLDKSNLINFKRMIKTINELRKNIKSSRFNIIVEGIETEEAHKFIKSHNIKAQGYYYGRPKRASYYSTNSSLRKESHFLSIKT